MGSKGKSRRRVLQLYSTTVTKRQCAQPTRARSEEEWVRLMADRKRQNLVVGEQPMVALAAGRSQASRHIRHGLRFQQTHQRIFDRIGTKEIAARVVMSHIVATQVLCRTFIESRQFVSMSQ